MSLERRRRSSTVERVQRTDRFSYLLRTAAAYSHFARVTVWFFSFFFFSVFVNAFETTDVRNTSTDRQLGFRSIDWTNSFNSILTSVNKHKYRDNLRVRYGALRFFFLAFRPYVYFVQNNAFLLEHHALHRNYIIYIRKYSMVYFFFFHRSIFKRFVFHLYSLLNFQLNVICLRAEIFELCHSHDFVLTSVP